TALLATGTVPVPRTQAAGCVIARHKTAAPDAKVTYGTDVAPLLERYCITCHRPGEAGPMSLTSYEQAATWSDTILEVLRENRMPPSGLAPPDPRYGDFVASPEPSAAEIDTIASWVAAGTPSGPKRAAPRLADNAATWQIGKPDLILQMPKTYRIPASGVV